jgi:hypothetical protein
MKIPDVADVQEVEAAIRKRHGSTRRAIARDGFDEFRLGQEHVQTSNF